MPRPRAELLIGSRAEIAAFFAKYDGKTPAEIARSITSAEVRQLQFIVDASVKVEAGPDREDSRALQALDDNLVSVGRILPAGPSLI